jgi:hypothetical protein
MTVIPANNPSAYLGVRAKNPPNVTLSSSNPTTSTSGIIGDMIVNTATGDSFQLVQQSGTTYTWNDLGSGSTSIATINTNAPIGGNYTLAGTANQIAKTDTAGTTTFSLIGPYTPATYTAHGVLLGEGTGSIVATSVGATGTLLAGATGADPAFTGSPSVSGSLTAGTSITATNGNLVLGTAGNKLSITTGSNASVGVSGNMSGSPGAIAVATTACTGSSVILFSRATTGGTPGQVSITAQSTSGFTLTSTGNETSTFNYLIIN